MQQCWQALWTPSEPSQRGLMGLEQGNVPPQGGSQTPPYVSTYGRWAYLSRAWCPDSPPPCLSTTGGLTSPGSLPGPSVRVSPSNPEFSAFPSRMCRQTVVRATGNQRFSPLIERRICDAFTQHLCLCEPFPGPGVRAVPAPVSGAQASLRLKLFLWSFQGWLSWRGEGSGSPREESTRSSKEKTQAPPSSPLWGHPPGLSLEGPSCP